MASKYRKKFELPQDFYDILENYSREVLRDQPLDIIEFSYLYFKAVEEVSNFIAWSFALDDLRLLWNKISSKVVTNIFVKGTIDQFDYPKKGKNIPPSKHDAPIREEQPEEDEEEQAAASYYDENGNRVEQEYGDEGQQEDGQDGYGEEQEQAYGDEGQ